MIECERPNEYLYKFSGKLILNSDPYGLSVDQILLRGSSLRNTEWIYGIVVYTGHETKIMKNSVNSKTKYSKLELATNFYILIILLIQICVCLIASSIATVWELRDYESVSYL